MREAGSQDFFCFDKASSFNAQQKKREGELHAHKGERASLRRTGTFARVDHPAQRTSPGFSRGTRRLSQAANPAAPGGLRAMGDGCCLPGLAFLDAISLALGWLGGGRPWA